MVLATAPDLSGFSSDRGLGQQLEEIFAEARRQGHIGPAALREQLEHSSAFAALVKETGGDAPTLVDIGSGGGLPGLVLAAAMPSASVTLLEGSSRRAAWLRLAIADLRLPNEVAVVGLRAEEAAHREEMRGRFDIVTARAFGSPAVTAECAAGFLRVGGRLVVSEPPAAAPERWPAGPLQELGLAEPARRAMAGRSFAVLVCKEPTPARFPRRTGIPAKRPLF
jgi:SAM-dependent methyltransferase